MGAQYSRCGRTFNERMGTVTALSLDSAPVTRPVTVPHGLTLLWTLICQLPPHSPGPPLQITSCENWSHSIKAQCLRAVTSPPADTEG